MKKQKASIHPTYFKELIRRRDEVRTGKAKPIPAPTVYRRINRLLDK
jgi:hypothetical protein